MKYLIITQKNNGYFCSCCRQDWTEVEEENIVTEDFSREEIENLNKTIADRYPNGKIYRVAETIRD